MERPPAELDLRLAARLLWQKRRYLLASCLCTTGIAIAYAFLAPQWFKADVVVAMTETKGGGLNVGQLGGLASLAGIALPSMTENATPMGVLNSRELAREFVVAHDLGRLFFPRSWPKVEGSAQPPESRSTKDVRDAVKYFIERVRSVSEDKKTGLITLSIRWKDPALAATWANEYVKRTNELLRDRALRDSERNVKFLQEQIATSSIPSLQESLGRVLESEMQKFLLARGNEEFAFKVVDPAYAPKFRDSPKRVLVVLAGFLLGLIGSAMAMLFLHSDKVEARA